MHEHEPSVPTSRPDGRDRHRRRGRRRTVASLVVVLALAGLAAFAPTVAARPGTARSSSAPAIPPTTTDPPDPPESTTRPPVTHPTPPPTPNPECDDAAGLTRPTGSVPPGYVYTPTKFDGSVKDPQPDDTFATDAAGHAVHTGKLRTRVVGGQEQLLVCAHVGTNTPTDALTPFPTTGTGAHAPTIAPRVVLIDSVGRTTSFDFGATGTDSTLAHYVGSTDVHEGYAQMWVPFNPNLREPGFVVRVEVRGTPALTPGGSTKVMGADEVFVHLGPAPTSAGSSVTQAVGVAVDASAIGERPSDPGPDDLAAVLEPMLKPLISSRIRAFAPQDLDLGVDGELWGWSNITFGSARLDSLGNNVRSAKVDVENFNATEGRGVVNIDASLFPSLTVSPRSIGLVSITGGSCRASATVDVSIRAGFVVDLSPDGAKPKMRITFVVTSGTVQSVSVSGRLDVWWIGSISCSRIEDDVRDGIDDGMAERLQGLQNDLALRADVEKQVAEMLTPANLADGPLSGAEVDLPNGVGFSLNGLRYVPTAPAGHLGGDVLITDQGVNLAVSANVDDQGSGRFPYSYVPSQTSDLVSNLPGRGRPGTGTPFDVGLLVSGATVNQLSRALTAGELRSPIVGTTTGTNTTAAKVGSTVLDAKVDVGLLDLATKVSGLSVTVHPATTPMYLPTPPTGWPDIARSDVNLYLPSLRVGIPLPGVATMATDVRMGMTATIDATNHLVPIARASKVDVAPRFLRLGSDTNVVTDPAVEPGNLVGLATSAVKANVPGAVGAMLEPIQIPDLSVGDVHVHVDRLTVGTVGGGHLGAFVDVDAGPGSSGPLPLEVAMTGSQETGPTSLTATVLPPAIPLPDDTEHPATVSWTMSDANAPTGTAPLYATPSDPTTPETFTKTLAVGGLTPSAADPCTGRRDAVVKVSARVTKDGVVRTSSTYATFGYGTPPDHVPGICNHEDPPPTEPEPTIPPLCRVKPWMCDDF